MLLETTAVNPVGVAAVVVEIAAVVVGIVGDRHSPNRFINQAV